MDGYGWSSRWQKLLSTNSVVLKSTIYVSSSFRHLYRSVSDISHCLVYTFHDLDANANAVLISISISIPISITTTPDPTRSPNGGPPKRSRGTTTSLLNTTIPTSGTSSLFSTERRTLTGLSALLLLPLAGLWGLLGLPLRRRRRRRKKKKKRSGRKRTLGGRGEKRGWRRRSLNGGWGWLRRT